MRRTLFFLGVLLVAAALFFFFDNRDPRTVDASAIVLSTGAINDYGGSANLFHDIAEANDFRAWYIFAGNSVFTAWTDGNVWGSDLIDASCPTEVPEITQLFPIFGGLHMVTGNSGDVNHDTLDSEARGNEFGIQTAGTPFIFFPQLPVGDAWMNTGLIDVQSQVCAVAAAAGNTRDDAINRRENERVTSGWSNPSNNWMAWKWVCN